MTDTNKMTDDTNIQPSSCANGCGFFSTAATNGFCSKCFRDVQITTSAKAAINKLFSPQPPSSSSSRSEPFPPPAAVFVDVKENVMNRCLICKKKVGVMGFKCKCGDTFCGSHRYPEKHECEFDFKKTGRNAIAKAIPVMKADKMNRI